MAKTNTNVVPFSTLAKKAGVTKFISFAERNAEEIGKTILSDINQYLSEVDYFTREDLLHLPGLDHVATITRYSYILAGVRWLIEKGEIASMNRTDLCTKEKVAAFHKLLPDSDMAVKYRRHILRLINGHKQTHFSMMDIVRRWTTDPHLSTNAKRVVARRVFKSLVFTGVLVDTGDFTYAKAGEA